MQKMCRCLLLVVAFVALAKGHRSRRAVVEFTEEQKDILVDKHNELRRLAGASDMEKMRWNDELANMAALWAGRCVYKHGQPANTTKYWIGNNKPGQNIFAKWGRRPFDLANSTQSWYSEVKDYNYDSNTCPSGAQCGHYTQIVWAESRELGCAVARCDPLGGKVQATGPADYFVCNYGPAGNNGDRPYKKGAACSACRSGHGWCEDGLCRRDCNVADNNCECDLKCANGGVFNKSACSCTCTNGWTGADCSSECKDDKTCNSWSNCDVTKVKNMCPLTCGQCAPGCANSGVFNEETKSCVCAQGWAGVDCTRECKDDDNECSKSSCKGNDYIQRHCPLMCGLCAPECANSGVFNETTRTCTCAQGWAGVDCTRECKDDNECGVSLPKLWCSVYDDVLRRCPLMCGQCVPDCANSGVYNEKTKSCDCAKGWTGLDCTSECKNHNKKCGTTWPERYCQSYSWTERECPLMCGLC